MGQPEENPMLLGHLHRMEDDDSEADAPATSTVFTEAESAQIVDLVRVALGDLLDPPDADADKRATAEFWLATFPAIVTFCGGCATITVQVLGRNVETVHFAIDMSETLRSAVKAAPDEDLVVAYQRRYHPEITGDDEGSPWLYMSRIAYRVDLPEQDPVWAMVAEMVNLFDALFGIFVSAAVE